MFSLCSRPSLAKQLSVTARHGGGGVEAHQVSSTASISLQLRLPAWISSKINLLYTLKGTENTFFFSFEWASKCFLRDPWNKSSGFGKSSNWNVRFQRLFENVIVDFLQMLSQKSRRYGFWLITEMVQGTLFGTRGKTNLKGTDSYIF